MRAHMRGRRFAACFCRFLYYFGGKSIDYFLADGYNKARILMEEALIMDTLGIVGLVVGVISLIVGMYFKHVPFSALNNPAAFFIILVGTVGAVMIATPGNELKNLKKLFGILFGKPRYIQPEEAVAKVLEMADVARKNGLLALESRLDSEKDAFIVHGLNLLIDGANSDQIYSSLEEDISAMEGRHAAGAQIFVQAGTYAPTLGVLGAVLGLIAALSDLNDIDTLGAAISAAFVATLLGIFTGYVLWHPMANRLKRKSRQEILVKTIFMEGFIGICAGTSPKILRDDLLKYIPAGERAERAVTEGAE
jgi:chemotaxis protein MotA